MIHFFLVCFIGDILPFCFLGERLRTRVVDADEAKYMSFNAPKLYYKSVRIINFAPLGTRSFLSFWFPFSGHRVVRSLCSIQEICSYRLGGCGSCGSLAATPEAPIEAGIDDELHFLVIELELQVCVFVFRGRWEYFTLTSLCRY